MTDLELLGAIGGGAVALGGAARWLVGIWRETSKENTTALVAAQEKTERALLDNTASNTRVCERLEVFGEQLGKVEEFVRKHVTIQPPTKKRAQTFPHGAPVQRHTTNRGGDE